MVDERRAPGVQHGRDADPGAEMAFIPGDREQGLGDDLEHEIVDGALVLIGDGAQGLREREDDMEVRDRQ